MTLLEKHYGTHQKPNHRSNANSVCNGDQDIQKIAKVIIFDFKSLFSHRIYRLLILPEA